MRRKMPTNKQTKDKQKKLGIKVEEMKECTWA